ncbi:MAG: hypothetical protein IJ815_08770, partial [Lachnospiraceae bacterium]|nr:hypothetical protein [Lachnospiraceae bacterium]
VPYKRHKSQQDVQKKDWARFFSFKENSLHDWVITSVNDEPALDLKVTRSVYGNNASCIIAKSLHENEDELKKTGKACVVDKDGSYEVFMSGKEMNRLIGVGSYTDYVPLSYDQIAEINKEMAEKYEDKELNYMEQIQRDLELKKTVSAEIPDIDLYIKQFPAKARSIIGSTLNNLKWKNIVYYSYTELYTDLNTGKSDVLLRDKNLLNEVLSVRQKVLDKYGFKDERSVFYFNGGKYKADYFNDLNETLRSELGVKVFRGYYIFIHPGHLKRYYDRMQLEGKPLDIFRKELYEKIRKQQLLTAKEYTAKADKIADEGYGEMLPALSDDYEAVSDALMDMLIPYTDLGSEFECVDMFLPMETLEDIAESGGLEARGPLSRLG